MSKITPTLLNDTLRLVQLARETALVQGKQAQAQRLTPVVKDLRSLVSSTREAQTGKAPAGTAPAGSTPTGVAPTGVMGQSDFRTLLDAARKAPEAQQPARNLNSSEKNNMVMAMSAGSMSDVDIARQMGMTRDEVRLILSVGRKARPAGEVSG